MQEHDARLIEALRLRCAVRCMLMNQSEVVRVGLSVLAEMTDLALCEKAESFYWRAWICPRR